MSRRNPSTFQSRAIGYASNIGGVNMEKVLVYVGLGIGAYLLYKTFNAGLAVKNVLNSTGSAIGTGLYDLFHPNAAQRATSTNFVVWFYAAGGYPAQFHSVDSLDVSESGIFAREGVSYQMVALKTPQKAPDGRTISKVAIRQ